MIIDTAGDYTLRYTATDECGNSTFVDRSITVEQPPRTVLYTDGTFIINELARDIDANVALHGAAMKVYAPFNPNGTTDVERYVFSAKTDRPWNLQSQSVTNVIIGSKIHPTSTNWWFETFGACVSIDLRNLDTSNTTTMYAMFDSCSALTSIDVSHFDTSNVTNMNSMFWHCGSLTSLDVSHFNTSNVTDMVAMFDGCSALTSIDVSHFDTSNVTRMRRLFYNCTALTSLDVSHFDTSNVTDMYEMFYNCAALTSLDVSHFDTSNVTNMNGMFALCQTLTSIDLTNFNTSNVTDMSSMFAVSSNLETIYASSTFVVSGVTASNNMFGNTTSLVGGAGTTWNRNNPTDKTYAHIDGGTSDPGYFTAKPSA